MNSGNNGNKHSTLLGSLFHSVHTVIRAWSEETAMEPGDDPGEEPDGSPESTCTDSKKETAAAVAENTVSAQTDDTNIHQLNNSINKSRSACTEGDGGIFDFSIDSIGNGGSGGSGGIMTQDAPMFQIGKYMVWEEIIGHGSFSVVHKGYHLETKKLVAVKCIIVKTKELNRIRFEINIMKGLDHPNVVKLYDVIEKGNKIYLIMEYCSGGTLDKYKDCVHGLSESQIHNYMLSLKNGLKYLRGKNILHRDLKPQNLLLTEDNILKISDFGLSTNLENDRLTDTVCGSPIYMAPEVLGSNLYGVKSDLWSVGIILYQLIYRRHPYVFNNVIELIREINTRKVRYPACDVSQHCIDLLRGLLQTRTDNRISWGAFFVHRWFEQRSFNQEQYLLSNQSRQKHVRENKEGKEGKGKSKQPARTVTPTEEKEPGAGTGTSIGTTRPDRQLSLQDFMCENYHSYLDEPGSFNDPDINRPISRSAPVRQTYTSSIRSFKSKFRYGAGKSVGIGKVTKRTSCIIPKQNQ